MKLTFTRGGSRGRSHSVYGRSWVFPSPEEGGIRHEVYAADSTRLWSFRLFGGSR